MKISYLSRIAFILGIFFSTQTVDETYSIYGLAQVIDNLKLGFAYDITQSDVNLLNDNGSMEVILKYQF